MPINKDSIIIVHWPSGLMELKLNKIQQLVPKWKTRNSEACFSNWFGNSLVGLALSTIRRRRKSKTNSIRKKRNVYIIVQRWLTFLYILLEFQRITLFLDGRKNNDITLEIFVAICFQFSPSSLSNCLRHWWIFLLT